MKHLKTYENLNMEPKVGDYILMRVNLQTYKYKDIVNKFINNTIGKVYKLEQYDNIRVIYDNIPNEIKSWFSIIDGQYTRIFDKNQIVAFSKNKEELELKINAKKYNI